MTKSQDAATAPVAEAGMLIRRPVADVFAAFIDPAITSRFWFTHGSGRLEAGATVTWTWAMYGASTRVAVRAIDVDRRILVDWDLESSPTAVEWHFAPRDDGTWMTVTNSGFAADADGIAKALDAAGGFALVLGGAKIWLEHGIEPRFVLDRHPDHRVAGYDAASGAR